MTENLKLAENGIWYASEKADISYPTQGNDDCFEIEDKSFWFQHRNACIVELVKRFPPPGNGPIFDVGGGNGFVAKGLMDAGWDVVLVEPGQAGARNAMVRGVQQVVCATTHAAGFGEGSMPGIGVFDVVEHIEDDEGFMRHLHDLLEPGGMLYLTVPAYRLLWSDADDYGGHFRRYSKRGLKALCEVAGFDVQFLTGIFVWLIAPILLFRSLPYRLMGKSKENIADVNATMTDHTMPEWLERSTRRCHEWERRRILNGNGVSLGASLLLAAKRSSSGAGV